jgi:hypothetical protein
VTADRVATTEGDVRERHHLTAAVAAEARPHAIEATQRDRDDRAARAADRADA